MNYKTGGVTLQDLQSPAATESYYNTGAGYLNTGAGYLKDAAGKAAAAAGIARAKP